MAAQSVEPNWVRDPQEAASIAKATSVQRWTSSTSSSVPANQAYDSISLSSASASAALAGALYEILDDGSEELVGHLVLEPVMPKPNSFTVGTNTSLSLDPARLGNAKRSFVLRPEPETAKSLIEPGRVLGVPVWFMDVTSSAASWRPVAGTAVPPSHAGSEKAEPETGQK